MVAMVGAGEMMQYPIQLIYLNYTKYGNAVKNELKYKRKGKGGGREKPPVQKVSMPTCVKPISTIACVMVASA